MSRQNHEVCKKRINLACVSYRLLIYHTKNPDFNNFMPKNWIRTIFFIVIVVFVYYLQEYPNLRVFIVSRQRVKTVGDFFQTIKVNIKSSVKIVVVMNLNCDFLHFPFFKIFAPWSIVYTYPDDNTLSFQLNLYACIQTWHFGKYLPQKNVQKCFSQSSISILQFGFYCTFGDILYSLASM